MRILAIDPSVRRLGWALFEYGELTACGLLKAEGVNEMLLHLKGLPSADMVAVEMPVIYPARRQPVDPNDLIQTALVAGAAARCGRVPKFLRPSEWKGQTPKDISVQRTLETLSVSDRNVLDRTPIPRSMLHNVVDAIGIGRYVIAHYA